MIRYLVIKMMFQTHLMFSLLIGLYLMERFSNKYLFLILVLIGTMLPDLDNPYSKLGRKVRPVSSLIKFIFGHRKLFHSLIFVSLLFFVIYYILDFKLIGIALSVGFVLHLVLDGLTKEGINYFYPFLKFRVSGFIKTNGILEWFLFCILVLFVGLKVVL